MSSWECIPSFHQVVFILAGFFLLKFLIKRLFAKDHSKVAIQKADWEKDVVYLYQFPRSPILPNLSPFCLKIETWLRANNIKHEIITTWMKRGREGLLPFVELNGHHYADSQLIIAHLVKHFKTRDNSLNSDQRTLNRALDRMVEGSLTFTFGCVRVPHSSETLSSEVTGLPLPRFVTDILSWLMSSAYVSRLSAQGMYKHEHGDILNIMRRDMQALSDTLGDKKFLLGDEIHEADCTLFGHLAVCYYMPYDLPMKRMMVEEFKNLRDWLERVKDTAFGDEWVKCLKKQ